MGRPIDESVGSNRASSEGIVANLIERRADRRVRKHWEHARTDSSTPPSLAALDLGRNASLETVSFLLREDDRVEESVFVLCGKALARSFSGNPVGRKLGEAVPREICKQITKAIDRARAECCPVGCEGAYQRPDGSEIRFRSIFMPARSANDGPVGSGYIFGTFGQRDFSANAA